MISGYQDSLILKLLRCSKLKCYLSTIFRLKLSQYHQSKNTKKLQNQNYKQWTVNTNNFLGQRFPDASNSKNIKTNSPGASDSKNIKTNCPNASNSQNIKNSQSELCQLFKNNFLCQTVSILSDYKLTILTLSYFHYWI